MAQDPKARPGDGETPRTTPDAAEFPVGGGVLSGRREDAGAPMTEVQAAELRRLCESRDEAFDATLTREQADARIAALKG